jgi:hypothetical protein
VIQALWLISAERQPRLVDIHQREVAVFQTVDLEDIGHELAGEDRAASPYYGNVGHV